MKIYTYYENINFQNQDELVALWENSWKDHGFEPIVLTRKDAEKADFYKEFVAETTRLHQEIAGMPLKKYGLSCWLRWLAYSTQIEEKFYVSDYDVINHNFNPIEPENTLHLMDNCCPCFASGTPSQFLTLCKKFISVTEQNIKKYIEMYKERKFRHFHDQEFFCLYYHDKIIDKDEDIKMTRDRNFISDPPRHDFWNKPLVHYSHYACKEFCNKTDIKFDDVARCDIIKQYTK
jgi:hypothetical protein